MDIEISLLLLCFAIMACGAAFIFFMTLAHATNRLRGWAAFVFVAVASIIVVGICGNVLISGETITGELKMFRIDVINSSLHFSIDRLSAFFMILVMVLSLPATLFSISYMEAKDIRGYYVPLILFIMGMLGLLCVDDFFFFFVPWEVMSLSAYALILLDKKDPEALRAGLKFFIVTHFGTTCMFIGAIIIYLHLPQNEASFSFSALSRSMWLMMDTHPIFLNLALALLFIGFVTKAGVFPFGFLWLPDAHPAAPSPVSSILSGVMIKMGVYALIRTFLFLLPTGSVTFGWGWTIAIFGALSLFLGTLRAMMQHDSKVLLAYHSIGQIGYITLALGVGMVLLEKSALIAIVALVAGLYHLMNHTCFKGLLFLNAGAVIHKTGLRDMDKLGGLSKILPVTSVAALIAVFSIGGLPGFSGFVSKWMIYQSSIIGGRQFPLFILMGIAAIFISVVTIVSVLKFYSAMFLGNIPESFKALKRREDAAIKIPQMFLAVLCILLGIIPVLGVLPGFAIFADMPPLKMAEYARVFGEFNLFSIVLHTETQTGGISTIGVWNPMLTMIVFVALGLFGYFVRRSAGAKVRTVDNWYCGSVVGEEEVIYRASSYYLYVKEFFDLVNKRFIPSKMEFKTDFSRVLNIDHWLYYPLSRRLVSMCNRLARSHVGVTHIYLVWTVIGAIITIVVLFWASGGR